MSTGLLPLIVAMGLVTWLMRSLPLLVPGLERLPAPALAYLRLVAPSVLGAVAAVNTAVAVDDAGHPAFTVGIEWLAVGLCVGLTAWRGYLVPGIVAAVALAFAGRAIGFA